MESRACFVLCVLSPALACAPAPSAGSPSAPPPTASPLLAPSATSPLESPSSVAPEPRAASEEPRKAQESPSEGKLEATPPPAAPDWALDTDTSANPDSPPESTAGEASASDGAPAVVNLPPQCTVVSGGREVTVACAALCFSLLNGRSLNSSDVEPSTRRPPLPIGATMVQVKECLGPPRRVVAGGSLWVYQRRTGDCYWRRTSKIRFFNGRVVAVAHKESITGVHCR